MEKTIENTVEMIQDGAYEMTKKNRLGAGMLRDNLTALLEDLHLAGTVEGHSYQHLVMLVQVGEPLPKPFTTRILEIAEGTKTYEVRIKDIVDLQWVKEGIIVEFNGTQRQIEGTTAETESKTN
jgi:hypothetical protein